MNKDYIRNANLRNGQKRAFFSYADLYKKSELSLTNLATTISAMANTIGGEILVGIEIKNGKLISWEDKPAQFPSVDTFLELLEDYFLPQISNLKISCEDSALFIEVPGSRQKPHMFLNYKFYKRLLSKNQVMEEFELRQLYQSTLKPDLQIVSLSNLQGIPLMSGGLFETMKFYPRIQIQNVGQKLEKHYKLEISLPSFLVDETFTVLHKYLKGYGKETNIYSIPSTEPLFQNESKTLLELVLILNGENYAKFLDSEIELKLYSTEKVHELTYPCVDWLHYKGNLPKIESFTKKLKE